MTREEWERQKDKIALDAMISLMGKTCSNCVFGSEKSKRCYYHGDRKHTFDENQINQCMEWEFEGFHGN